MIAKNANNSNGGGKPPPYGKWIDRKEYNMNKLLENLAQLVKVKTIVTLAVTVIFGILALKGVITPDNVMVIVSMVVSFYFGTQHEKDK